MSLMRILSFFRSRLAQNKPQEGRPLTPVVVDLGAFKIGSTPLGSPISKSDPFYTALAKTEVFQPNAQGLEIGTKKGLLDYGFFDLDFFNGSFSLRGQPLAIDKTFTELQLVKFFGEPYWIERSDGEVIMFYEYQAGNIELQFELTAEKTLAFVTLSKEGVLSDLQQRKGYGVTKPWPPK